MKVILKVVKGSSSSKGNILLSNKHVNLTSPQRSKLLNGKKLKEGDSYLLTLEKIKVKEEVKKKKKVTKKPTKKKRR